MCVSDCQKDPRNQAKPPSHYADGASDDEEWIKSDPLGTPVSEFYADALEAMRLLDTQYYTRLCKQKLLWAAKPHLAPSRFVRRKTNRGRPLRRGPPGCAISDI